MAHGANKHCVFKPLNSKGTDRADFLACWNTDPADYPDYAVAPLKVEGANQKRTHDTMVPLHSAALGPFSDIQGEIMSDRVEEIVAPAAIERALTIYQQLQHRDPSVLLQARKILTEHIYGMVDRGEHNEQRLMVGGLVQLKAVERDHSIKSAQEAPIKKLAKAST